MLTTNHAPAQKPIPLRVPNSLQAPYPIDALPSVLKKTVSSYQSYGQQPLPLIACGALANASLACQSLANVARDKFLISPISLYFLVIAGSGERKSASDNVFSKPIRAWVDAIQSIRFKEIKSAMSLHQAWKIEKEGVLSQIKRSAFTGEDSDYYKDLFEDLMANEPEVPILPSLYFEDSTQEALATHLALGWPSSSLWSDEAGIFLGSQSMQSNPTRFVALLNRLWDGKSMSTHRKSSQSFVIQNRRLTISLMMQPLLLDKMNAQGAGINRQSGFLARTLMAYPQSSMGNRFYQEPDASNIDFTEYESRITDCLNQSKRLTQAGCINLPTLNMSKSAKSTWVLFFNGLESGLKEEGQWSGIQDFASKAAENVARLAAILHLFDGRSGDITTEYVESSIEIIYWHLHEARRLLAPEGVLSDDMVSAQKLLSWLHDRQVSQITLRDILRLSPVRDKTSRDDALEILLAHHQVIFSIVDGSDGVSVNR